MAFVGSVQREQQERRRREGEQEIELSSKAGKGRIFLVIPAQRLQGQLLQEEGRDLREGS